MAANWKTLAITGWSNPKNGINVVREHAPPPEEKNDKNSLLDALVKIHGKGGVEGEGIVGDIKSGTIFVIPLDGGMAIPYPLEDIRISRAITE